ncbi:putative amidohydrolase [Halarchaeum solikamskense]|uniref:nitrilase family protein n=1 Tax=Halarchaeum nitratireducens TaxID=489913 RepID=UPI001B3A89AF|nr:nitrilase family protein [Halarchaeum solikamskense]MBP2252409.1 putative amidohydrolase [Halarchaeum solikamskense]
MTDAAPLDVAVVQSNPTFGDVTANRQTLADRIRDAAGDGADLVVLPELANTGYVFETRAEAFDLAESANGPTVSSWIAAASDADVWIVGGFAERDRNRTYNSAAIVSPDGVEDVYRKAHLWDREKLFFESGDGDFPIVDTPFGRLGVQICHDLWFPEATRLQALDGADIVALPTNWPYEGERPSEWTAGVHLAIARATTNRVFFACADRCGTERGVDFEGQSVVVDPAGRPRVGPASVTDAETLRASLDLANARDKRLAPYADALADRRTDAYSLAGREK